MYKEHIIYILWSRYFENNKINEKTNLNFDKSIGNRHIESFKKEEKKSKYEFVMIKCPRFIVNIRVFTIHWTGITLCFITRLILVEELYIVYVYIHIQHSIQSLYMRPQRAQLNGVLCKVPNYTCILYTAIYTWWAA